MTSANSTKNVVKLMKAAMQYLTQNSSEFGSFGYSLRKLNFVEGNIGRCITSMKIEQEHTNIFGTMHGGCTATIIDDASTLALVDDSEESLKHLGVSVKINVDYIKPAKLGTEIIVDARLKKRGRTLAFLDVEIRDKNSNAIIATGSHTKFV